MRGDFNPESVNDLPANQFEMRVIEETKCISCNKPFDKNIRSVFAEMGDGEIIWWHGLNRKTQRPICGWSPGRRSCILCGKKIWKVVQDYKGSYTSMCDRCTHKAESPQ